MTERVGAGIILLLVLVMNFANCTNGLIEVNLTDDELDEYYQRAEYLYVNATHHWHMDYGFVDMNGTNGSYVCFVEGPEADALILGMNSTEELPSMLNATVELLDNSQPVKFLSSDALSDFTVSMWYSFYPASEPGDKPINSMKCELLRIKSGSKRIAISYSGGEQYNLTYKYVDKENVMPYIIEGAAYSDSEDWQWNHVTLTFKESKLTSYYNGFTLNSTDQRSQTAVTDDHGQDGVFLNYPIISTSCGPVGIDEVILWNTQLTEYDALALRLYIGKNKSENAPTTTEAGPSTETSTETTTPQATTTTTTSTSSTSTSTAAPAAESTATSPTTASTVTSSAPGGSSTTGEDPSKSPTTPSPTTPSPTTERETTERETTERETTERETTEITTTQRPTTKRETTRSSTGEDAQTSPDTTEQVAHSTTIKNIPEIDTEINNILRSINGKTNSTEITESLDSIDNNFQDASVDQAVGYTKEILNILNKTASIDISESNAKNYREAYVGLLSSLLVKLDEVEPELINQGDQLVDIVDSFLENYVEDPSITEVETIFSDAVDIYIAPVDGKDVILRNNASVKIPLNAFSSSAVAGDTKVVICTLKKGIQNKVQPMGTDQPTNINVTYKVSPTWNISGPILVMKVRGSSGFVQLQNNVTFSLTIDPKLGDRPFCVFQDASSKWSGKGVSLAKVYKTGGTEVVCQTNHMTNFAVLMAVDGVELPPEHNAALSYISYIGCGLSILCLTIAIIIFIVFRELNSTRMGIVKNLCVALFFAQLLFVAGIQTALVNEIACKAVAVLLHYFFLCVMAWMLCNGIYLYLKVKKAARPGSSIDLIYFSALGWGAPALVVGVTAGIDHGVYGTPELCWLSIEGMGIWAFVGPAMIIILFNAFVTFLTMKAFVSVKVFKDKSDKDKFKSGLRAVVVMLPILGLSWIFGLLAFGDTALLFQYLFAIFNSLQGVFLFVFHIVLNEEVKNAMRRRLSKVGASKEDNMLFNKIWSFSSAAPEKSTEMSSVSQQPQTTTSPVYKN